MIVKPHYEDSPGMAAAEALRLYRLGKECKAAADMGVTPRQLCVMTGMSMSAVKECITVSELYRDDTEFAKAFQDHDLPPGASHRTWGSMLFSLGINAVSKREAEQMLSNVKATVQRLTMVAQGTADPEVAYQPLGQLRAWLMGRIPPMIWATIDRNFFLYQPCSFCSGDAEEPELVECNGLLLTKCSQCRAEGVQIGSANWQTVATSYAAYAYECNHAAEIYRAA